MKQEQFLELVKEIINTNEYKKRKQYRHHDDSVYEHCLKVAWLSFLITKKLRLDWRSATIGALLHDFYPDCWQTNNKKGKIWNAHGFAHANLAYLNAQKHYPHLINKKVTNIIKRHMFPLNITPPLYLESWVVTFVDKYVSLKILTHPKDWTKYLGLRRKK